MRTSPLRWRTSAAAVRWTGTKKRALQLGAVFCELYAGGKYQNNAGGDYEFSLGLNGLGSCATQYSSEYMDATVRRDGYKYTLHFEKGELVGKLKKEPADRKATGSVFRWKPDLEVFTDIDIPREYFEDMLQAAGRGQRGRDVPFRDRSKAANSKTDYCYPNGILDYVNELAGEQTLTVPQFWEAERKGRDREDKPEYKVRISAALLLLQPRQPSRILPQLLLARARRRAGKGRQERLRLRHRRLLQADRTNTRRARAKITFQDVADCLVLVTNCFSTQTSYENQTKKAITNKFVQEAMTEFFRDRLQVYFIENKQEADRIMPIRCSSTSAAAKRRKRRG